MLEDINLQNECIYIILMTSDYYYKAARRQARYKKKGKTGWSRIKTYLPISATGGE